MRVVQLLVVMALAPGARTGIPPMVAAPHSVADAGTADAGDAVQVLTAENAELRATNAELRKLVADLEGNMARSTKEIQKRLSDLEYGTDAPSDPKRWSSGDALWFVLFGVVAGIAVGRIGRPKRQE